MYKEKKKVLKNDEVSRTHFVLINQNSRQQILQKFFTRTILYCYEQWRLKTEEKLVKMVATD